MRLRLTALASLALLLPPSVAIANDPGAARSAQAAAECAARRDELAREIRQDAIDIAALLNPAQPMPDAANEANAQQNIRAANEALRAALAAAQAMLAQQAAAQGNGN